MTTVRATGITDHERTMEVVVAWMDALAPAPAKHAPNKKLDSKI